MWWKTPTEQEQSLFREVVLVFLEKYLITRNALSRKCDMSYNTLAKFLAGADVSGMTIRKIKKGIAEYTEEYEKIEKQ